MKIHSRIFSKKSNLNHCRIRSRSTQTSQFSKRQINVNRKTQKKFIWWRKTFRISRKIWLILRNSVSIKTFTFIIVIERCVFFFLFKCFERISYFLRHCCVNFTMFIFRFSSNAILRRKKKFHWNSRCRVNEFAKSLIFFLSSRREFVYRSTTFVFVMTINASKIFFFETTIFERSFSQKFRTFFRINFCEFWQKIDETNEQ